MPVYGTAFIQQSAAVQHRTVSRALFHNRYGAARVDAHCFGYILRVADHQVIIKTRRRAGRTVRGFSERPRPSQTFWR